MRLRAGLLVIMGGTTEADDEVLLRGLAAKTLVTEGPFTSLWACSRAWLLLGRRGPLLLLLLFRRDDDNPLRGDNRRESFVVELAFPVVVAVVRGLPSSLSPILWLEEAGDIVIGRVESSRVESFGES